MVRYSNVALTMLIPFSGGKYLNIGWLAIPVLYLAVIGTVNGTNFTDGLDGLASSVTIMVATFFSVVAIGMDAGISPITCAVAGALAGFLLLNVHPASVFMGDTGSLALGGFVVSTAYMMQMPLFIPIVGLIYLVEVLSVMIQVTYYKKTGGKRIFRMAPIHHHFELGGWSETRVVAVFSIITAILCMIALPRCSAFGRKRRQDMELTGKKKYWSSVPGQAGLPQWSSCREKESRQFFLTETESLMWRH